MTYYLVYVSSAKRDLSANDLSEIVEVAIRKNLSLNITGLLLFQSGNILQLLEGDEEEVEKLFTTIQEDSRHHDVKKILTGEYKNRMFKDWSMGFKNLDGISNTAEYKSFINEKLGLRTFEADSQSTLKFLQLFIESNP